MWYARIAFFYSLPIREGERNMNFRKIMASAMVCAFALTGCGSNTATTSEDEDTFVVGMECAYAPFNWQTSEKTDTSVK